MIKIGLIGAGAKGVKHAEYYHQCPRSEVAAVADPDAGRAGELAAELGAQAAGEFSEILDLVDAVVISSPNHVHCEQAVAAAAAGKHIFCEKPMGIDLDQARQIASAVSAAGVRSVVGFSARCGSLVRTMVELVRRGSVGRVVAIRSRRLDYIDPAKNPAWRMDPARSGGLLYEINSHELDWMMLLGGEVRSVYARKFALDDSHPRANDYICILMDFAGGAAGTHEGSWISRVGDYYRGLEGTEATLSSENWAKKLFCTGKDGRKEELDMVESSDINGHFLDCIESGAESPQNAAWGLKVMAVADAAIESANSGKLVAPAS